MTSDHDLIFPGQVRGRVCERDGRRHHQHSGEEEEECGRGEAVRWRKVSEKIPPLLNIRQSDSIQIQSN